VTRYRLLAVPLAGVVAVLTGTLVFGGLNDNLVYYVQPSELASNAAATAGDRVRLGGLVEDGSVQRSDGLVRFTVTDRTTTVPVLFTGAPAQLFRAGIGVVVEGTWRNGVFHSDTMLVKHDEKYAPPTTTPSAVAPAAR